jgi:hypothetical protein
MTKYSGVSIGGGEFEIPQVKNGTYGAQIIKLEEGVGTWDEESYPQWTIDWELSDVEDPSTGNPVQLRQWMRIPAGLSFDPPVLSENSNCYELMVALGFNMGEGMEVDTDEWFGRYALLNVMNEPTKSGKNKGVVRPKIKSVVPFPVAAAKKATAPKEANPTPLRKRLEAVVASAIEEDTDESEYPWVGTLNALCDANEVGYPSIAKVLGFKKPTSEEFLFDAIDSRLTANPGRKVSAVLGELVGKAAALED